MSSVAGAPIPCFLCGRILKVKMTKQKKPYFICQHCGLQTFVRYPLGIDKLRNVLGSCAGFFERQEKTMEILVSVATLNELRSELSRLEDSRSLSDLLLPNSDQAAIRQRLEKEIRIVQKKLGQ